MAVPIVFVYAPSLLIVTQGFTWSEFVVALTGCILGILVLGAALTGYMPGAPAPETVDASE